jgi:hypothetical protein
LTVLRGYSEAWGKLIHEKKPEAKNLVTLSLNREKKELERGWKGVYSLFILGKRGGGWGLGVGTNCVERAIDILKLV